MTDIKDELDFLLSGWIDCNSPPAKLVGISLACLPGSAHCTIEEEKEEGTQGPPITQDQLGLQ